MRHQYSGKKFGQGQDANQALTRKLIVNFVRHGHITTTITKGKHVKAHVDRIVSLAQKQTQASKNMLLRALGDVELVEMLEAAIPSSFATRQSGFTTHERLGRRMSDGTMMVKLSWVEPVVLKSREVKKVEKKAPAKKEAVAKPATEKVVDEKKTASKKEAAK
jgi:large subunit ribosomal protein L17